MIAGLLENDPSLYKEAGPYAGLGYVTISRGALYQGNEPTAGDRGISWNGLLQKGHLAVDYDDPNIAMELLQGREYSVYGDNGILAGISIEGVWQATTPAWISESQSQYVPPYTPPQNNFEEDQGDTVEPE